MDGSCLLDAVRGLFHSSWCTHFSFSFHLTSILLSNASALPTTALEVALCAHEFVHELANIYPLWHILALIFIIQMSAIAGKTPHLISIPSTLVPL